MIKLGCDYLDSFAGFDEKSELYLWQIEPWSNIPLKSVIRTWNNGLVGNFEFDDWSNGVFKCYFSKHNNDGTNSRTLEPEGVGFAVGFCIMRCSNDDKDFDRTIMCVDDVFWAYCLMMKRTFYSNVATVILNKIFWLMKISIICIRKRGCLNILTKKLVIC